MIKSKIYLLSAFLIALSSCTSSKKQQEVEITSNVDRIILETDIGNDVTMLWRWICSTNTWIQTRLIY